MHKTHQSTFDVYASYRIVHIEAQVDYQTGGFCRSPMDFKKCKNEGMNLVTLQILVKCQSSQVKENKEQKEGNV